MRFPGAALLAPILVALAGCMGSGGWFSDDADEVEGFDGRAALRFAEGLALQDDGTPRFRTPGSAGQAEAADYLWEETDVEGWDRSWQHFTGADYLALERRAARGFIEPGGAACSQEEHDAVAGLEFSNLIVVRRHADPAAPLLLLGAHWDSPPSNTFDSDAENASLPNPGGSAASGVGVLLQLMRELEGVDLPFDVGLLFLDGGDGFFACYPLAGSLYYIAQALEPVKSFVVLNMVGDPAARFPREQQSQVSARGLQDLMWRHGQALGPEHFVDDVVPVLDDHLPTAVAGIPSVVLVDAGHPNTFPDYWMTNADTVDLLDPAVLKLVGDVVLATLQDPALEPLFP